MTIYDGGCYCGAIRYQIVGKPVWSAHCHCRSCQLALGGAMVTWAKVAANNFAVTKGVVKTIEKSAGIERGFCADCGTTINYAAQSTVEGQDWSADAWFSATTLDDPSIAAPKSHVYTDHQQPWLKLDDGLPTFAKF